MLLTYEEILLNLDTYSNPKTQHVVEGIVAKDSQNAHCVLEELSSHIIAIISNVQVRKLVCPSVQQI